MWFETLVSLPISESRDTPPWLLSQSSSAIRALLQHCSPEHYPPASLPEVVRSLSQLIHHTKSVSTGPMVFENALTALQSIVGRAATLYAPTARTNEPQTVTSTSSQGERFLTSVKEYLKYCIFDKQSVNQDSLL